MAIHTLPWDGTPPDECRRGAVSVGNFDGVHRGHAALLAELRQQAQAVGGPAVALTFDPHPSRLLRPDFVPPALTTLAERGRLLQECGADHVLVLTTTHDLLRLGAEEFFERVVRGHCEARTLVEGTNFRFGRDRGGDVDTLAALCRRDGVGMALVPPLLLDGEAVSSSRVRAALGRGDVRVAADCLGRSYRLAGTVGTGQRRGRTIGFPTANLEATATLVPADGVYAARVQVGAAVWPAAVNVGPNPTFGEDARKVEVHVIGFSGDLYASSLAVDFVERLRDTRPFGGVADLVAQLRADVEHARRLVT